LCSRSLLIPPHLPLFFFFIPPPPPTSPLFPYTTLFRSRVNDAGQQLSNRRGGHVRRDPRCSRQFLDLVDAQRLMDLVRGHRRIRSEEHTSELQSLTNLVCRLLLEKKKTSNYSQTLSHTQ